MNSRSSKEEVIPNPFQQLKEELSEIKNLLKNRQEDPLLTANEAAEFLRLSPAILYKMCSVPVEGVGPIHHSKWGRKFLFSIAELFAWLQETRRAAHTTQEA